MTNVRIPIETTREGNKITKVCVEDVYKIMNRVIESMDKVHNNSVDIINSIDKDYGKCHGSLIIGTGISQPCLGDAFDEEIGNNIAFMKAKLNANIKKHNFLVRIWNEYSKLLDLLDVDIDKIDSNIRMDLNNLRIYNPNYLNDLEEKLGIVSDEV